MVSGACDVVEDCIKHGASRNQQTRSNDAWRTIMAVLEMPEAKQAALDADPFASREPVADVSEKLRLIKQAERRAR